MSSSSFTSSHRGEEKAPPAKRPRVDPPQIDKNSLESMLAVPAEIIFHRQCSSQDKRPLLSRAEAETFLKVSFLAIEMDTLVRLAEELLIQQRYCRQYQKQLLETNLHPMLRPVMPIISLLENQPKPTLKHLQTTLCHLISELSACATTLRQSAEQNWTFSEAFHGISSADNSSWGKSLSEERRKLAELEDEICQRIEKLIVLSSSNDSSSSSSQDSLEETSTTTDQTNRILFSEKHSKNSQEDDTNTTTKLVVEEEETETLDIAPISEVCSKLFPDVNSSSSGDDDDDDNAKRKKNFMESQLSEQEDDDDDDEKESAQKSITVARLRTQPNFSSTTMSSHHDDDDDDDDSDTMNQESGSRDMIPSDSQASFVRRTNAAEVLAVMAGISN